MISLKKIPLYIINWGIQGFDNFHDWKEIIFRILIQWALDNWFCKSWRPKGHASIQPSTCGYYVSRLWECHIAVVRWMLRYPIPEGKLLLHPQSKLKLFFWLMTAYLLAGTAAYPITVFSLLCSSAAKFWTSEKMQINLLLLSINSVE